MAKRFDVSGYIVPDDSKWIYDYLEIKAVAYQDVKNFLAEADGEEIELYIDSPGGVLGVASDIYNELRMYRGDSISYIMNISASASSILMLGTRKVVALPTSRVMIHNARSRAEGTYKDMEEAKQWLIRADEIMINAYQIKTGKSRQELRALVDKSTWFTAQEALEIGLVDEIALKEGETLEAFPVTASWGDDIVATLDIQKIQELAKKYKDRQDAGALEAIKNEMQEEQEQAEAEAEQSSEDVDETETNDSGGESRPVSDTQKQDSIRIRKKIYNR